MRGQLARIAGASAVALATAIPAGAWADAAPPAPGPAYVAADTPDRAARQFRQITAGTDHACGVTWSGAALCWGRNDSGQLGDGTTQRRLTPTPVSGLSHGVRSISPGGWHTCAVLDNGSLKCWGDNGSGQLGDGTRRTRLRPVQVLGLFGGVAKVRAGEESTCALTTSGGVKCWGDNESGNLGDGTTQSRLTPVDVVGLTRGATGISVGDAHACALLATGVAKCWGSNGYGQLGDGTHGNLRPAPVTVKGLSGPATMVVAGGWSYTCAQTRAQRVQCWGNNEMGQLGRGTWDYDAHVAPTTVPGLSPGVDGLTAGFGHACARLTTGSMRCWGHGLDGELGNGQTPSESVAVNVLGMGSRVTSMSAGGYISCALRAGAGMCWGNNHYGQLGDGTTVQRNRPVAVK